MKDITVQEIINQAQKRLTEFTQKIENYEE